MKPFFKGIGILSGILILLFVLVLFNINTVVETAVNHFGPRITKTPTTLGGAEVSLIAADGYLQNFVLGNPEGFAAPHAISVGSLYVDIDETTLFDDILVIRRIEVVQPEIIYEIKGKTDNFRAILEKMESGKKPAPTTPTSEKTPESQGGRNVIIRDLVMKDVTLRTAAAVVGGEIAAARIPEIHLRNIGQEENGVGISQAAMTVLSDLYAQLLSSEAFGGIKGRLKDLGEGFRKEIKNLGNQFIRRTGISVEMDP